MPGYADLEKFVCESMLNRPDIEGVPDYTKAARPWFRDHLVRALYKIQKPIHAEVDGTRQMISGGDWRGNELDTAGNDPVYQVGNVAGLDYPKGFKKMKYVYVVNPLTGHVHRRPLVSVSEEEYNTERQARYGWNPAWGWWDASDWWDPAGWDYILGDGSWCGNRVRWMDKNGKFYLTHTPKFQNITLRMTYFGTVTAPTAQDYINNTSNYFTTELFEPLAALVAAMILDSAGEDQMASSKMQEAMQLIADEWALNQAVKQGSNSRVFIQPGSPRSQKGW